MTSRIFHAQGESMQYIQFVSHRRKQMRHFLYRVRLCLFGKCLHIYLYCNRLNDFHVDFKREGATRIRLAFD
jgi:hypothetical protein